MLYRKYVCDTSVVQVSHLCCYIQGRKIYYNLLLTLLTIYLSCTAIEYQMSLYSTAYSVGYLTKDIAERILYWQQYTRKK